ncbi:hypothetical protein EYF80_033570 [Liparis tanakae]|uniref:Uncharacterized protein n=1 Tax=Liparis tanakae TaxID=230148 RepID=A0A4Z2GUB7_9TELE|nr:hypothetical protein EYF80_033570 [Liparis tanakae]
MRPILSRGRDLLKKLETKTNLESSSGETSRGNRRLQEGSGALIAPPPAPRSAADEGKMDGQGKLNVEGGVREKGRERPAETFWCRKNRQNGGSSAQQREEQQISVRSENIQSVFLSRSGVALTDHHLILDGHFQLKGPRLNVSFVPSIGEGKSGTAKSSSKATPLCPRCTSGNNGRSRSRRSMYDSGDLHGQTKDESKPVVQSSPQNFLGTVSFK